MRRTSRPCDKCWTPEGWQVRVVPVVSQALGELSSGEWSLVIVNVAMIGLTSPIYLTLRELALAPAVEEGNVRARVLFVVPESAAREALPIFEREKLPYVLKPFQFHDLLEKVSDLLMEAAALANPIRRVRHDSNLSERKRKEGREGREAGNALAQRNTSMFAKRDEYVMTEEEIAEYEKTEKEAREGKRRRKEPPRKTATKLHPAGLNSPTILNRARPGWRLPDSHRATILRVRK